MVSGESDRHRHSEHSEESQRGIKCWREILRFKHPALKGHEKDVEECLADPDIVRSSLKDPDVHIYYRVSLKGYVCAVVGGTDNKDRFVITAYFTKKPKQGNELWTK